MDKRCEYSNYFRVVQTSFQTGVDKSIIENALTVCWKEERTFLILVRQFSVRVIQIGSKNSKLLLNIASQKITHEKTIQHQIH